MVIIITNAKEGQLIVHKKKKGD